MTMISNSATIYETLCTRRTKDEEITLRNSDECRRSVTEVANGNIDAKNQNYYRLVAGTAPADISEVYRANSSLVPSGKVLLDYDQTDWRTTIWPKLHGHETDLGVLHVERSCRDKLHITVRRIEGLTIEQTTQWFVNYFGVEFDLTSKILSQPCFLVPMDHVLYVDEDYYLDTVDTQQQDISTFQPETEAVTLDVEDNLDQFFTALADTAEDIPDLDLDPDPDPDADPESDLDLDMDSTSSTATAAVTAPVYHREYERDEDEFQRLVDFIVEQKADLTAQEETWFRLGIACYSVLGAYEGREAFHKISQFYPKYTYKETEAKFDHIVLSMYCNVGLGSLIYWCRQAGIFSPPTPKGGVKLG